MNKIKTWCPTVQLLFPPQVRGVKLLKDQYQLFPIARKVWARTLGSELVPVLPVRASSTGKPTP
jgi:hypothetical protein